MTIENDEADLDYVAARLAAALRAQAGAAEQLRPPAAALSPTGPDRSPRHARVVGLMAALTGVAAAAAMVLTMTVFAQGDSQQASRQPVGAHGASSSTVSRGHPTRMRAPAPTFAARRLSAAAGRALLTTMAGARGRIAAPRVGPGQYLHERTIMSGPIWVGDDGKERPSPAGTYSLDETWSTTDTTTPWVRLQRTVGNGKTSVDARWSGVCGDFYRHTQDPPPGQGCQRPGSFDDPTASFVDHLPRDPDRLYDAIRTTALGAVNPQKVHDVNTLMMMTIDDLLTDPALPADLAAATLRVLAKMPVRVFHDVTTFTGRRGTGVQYSTRSGVQTVGIIVDDPSGRYLGSYTGLPNTAGYSANDVTVDVVDSAPSTR